jgi:hypothetical protein
MSEVERVESLDLEETDDNSLDPPGPHSPVPLHAPLNLQQGDEEEDGGDPQEYQPGLAVRCPDIQLEHFSSEFAIGD